MLAAVTDVTVLNSGSDGAIEIAVDRNRGLTATGSGISYSRIG